MKDYHITSVTDGLGSKDCRADTAVLTYLLTAIYVKASIISNV